MTEERHQRVSELFLRAQDLPPDQRNDFLEAKCGGDTELRQRVESLLAQSPQAKEMFPDEGWTENLSGPDPDNPEEPARVPEEPSDVGRQVGHYKILEEIGRGGMGRVYRARHGKLPLDVAIKRPAPGHEADPEFYRRFMREARTAAKLSHTNIVKIFDVLEDEGVPWLVMELVKGHDLRQLVAERGALSLQKILHYGVGLAEGLQAAHKVRIMHRDVSPKNIIINQEGHALLLDFGLARYFIPPEDASQVSTQSFGITRSGGKVGTPAYMSPEQTMGRPLDARSDIFSLGAVFYEMCTGKAAFAADSEPEITDLILHRWPVPIARLNPEIPEELETFIRKAMAKDPRERYQEIRDLLVDLKVLEGRYQHDEFENLHPPDPIPDPPPQPWWRSRLAILAGTTVVGASLFTAWWIFGGGPQADSFPTYHSRRLTALPGWETDGVISPDGGLVAYSSDESGNPDIWIIDARGSKAIRLTDHPAVDRSPAWMPDGSAIVFVSERGSGTAIWKMPRLGGSATLLVPQAIDPAPSPDGAEIAFAYPANGDTQIVVASINDPGQRRTLTSDDDGLWYHVHPTWSPDGKTICYADAKNLWLVGASRGKPRQLTRSLGSDSEPAWSADGRFIYFSSFREGTLALWRVPASGGEPQRLTLGTGPERHPSVSRDGRRLVYSTFVEKSESMLMDMASGEVVPLGFLQDISAGPSCNELIFASTRWGRSSLWAQSLDHGQLRGEQRRLTDHKGEDSNPAHSPDGRWVAFQRVLEGKRDIWVMPASGGECARFTDHPADDFHPTWSPDGSEIAFVSAREGHDDVWAKRITEGRAEGGRARRVTTSAPTALGLSWSPAGEWIAFVGIKGGQSEIYVVPTSGGAARPVTENAGARWVDWDVASGMLLVSGSWGEGPLSLRRVSVQGGLPVSLEPAIDFGPLSRFGDFEVCPEANLLVYTREDARGDLWVLQAESGFY